MPKKKNDKELAKEVDYLWKRLEVVRVEGSQLFRINYLAESPAAAAAIVNMFAEELIREQIRKGEYLTEEKLNIAIARLLKEILG